MFARIAVATILALPCCIMAQGGDAADDALKHITESGADKPLTVAAATGEAGQLVGRFVGTFSAQAAGDQPALLFHGAPISVSGLADTVYFEISRADDPANPFRHGVLHAFDRQGVLTLRVFDLAGNPGLGDCMTGLWAAPASLPQLQVSQLDPNLDLPAAATDSVIELATAHPHPTTLNGAVEMTSNIRISLGMSPEGFSCTGFSLADRGFDASGKQVWGPPQAVAPTFVPFASTVTVKSEESGLTLITLVAGEGDSLLPQGEIAVQYTGWLTNGFRFDTSRQDGRQPFKVQIPSQLIQGWNDGLLGIRKGERRRLVIPGPLAYGERGAARAGIGPNETLIFDVECVWLQNAPPQTEPEEPTPNPANPDSAIP